MSARIQVQPKPPIQWSSVSPTPVNLEKLQLLTSTPGSLAKEGYVLAPLDERDIWRKNRCRNCGQRLKRYMPPVGGDGYEYGNDLISFEDDHNYNDEGADFDDEHRYMTNVMDVERSTIQQKHQCMFHDGNTFKGVYQCCGGRVNTKGCCSELTHRPCDLAEVRAEWQYHHTPAPILPSLPLQPLIPPSRGGGRGRRGGRGRAQYVNLTQHTPPRQPNNRAKDIRQAVALDCEMGTTTVGNSALIKLSAIDFFTQIPLIDRLVVPDYEMAHYNTRYSGVTFAMMRDARRDGSAIKGVDAARELLFRFVDTSTLIVMHGGSSDLTALRMIHPTDKIIDTLILERYDVEAKDLKKGLKEICERRCGIQVQNAVMTNGKMAGHDSLEDALGAREIVCAWLSAIPDD